MTAVHVITSDNRTLYAEALEEHHRIRHSIFVGERGWSDLFRPDGRDVDAYDDNNSIYLLAIDNTKIVGGQRLYPTVLPHMLSDVFPFLVKKNIPSCDSIFEISRYFVVKDRRFGRTDCIMLAGLLEFCIDEEITQLTAVVETWWLPRWQQAGFKVRPLGLPVVVEGQPSFAAVIDISSETLASVRRIAGLRGPVLIRQGLEKPVLERVRYAALS